MKKSLFLAYRNILRDTKSATFTFIAVLLSVFLIICGLAVTNSYSEYKIANAESTIHTYDMVVFDVPYKNVDLLKEDATIESFNAIKNLGYSIIENSVIENKKYLFFQELDSQGIENEAFEFQSGRKPATPNEIIIPLEYSKYFKYEVGDTITVTIGDRKTPSHYLYQLSSRLVESGLYEKEAVFEEKEEKTYRIVGVYKSSYSLYASDTLINQYYLYSYLDRSKLNEDSIVDVTIKFKNSESVGEYSEKYSALLEATFHNGNYSSIWKNYSADLNGKYFKSASSIFVAILTLTISFFMILVALDYGKEERKKYFAELTTIGVTTNELRESLILGNFLITILSSTLAVGLSLLYMFFLNSILIDSSYGTDYLKLMITHSNIIFSVLSILLILFVVGLKIYSNVLYIVPLDSIKGSTESIRTRFVRYSNIIKLRGEISKYVESNMKLKFTKTVILKLSIALCVITIIGISSFLTYATKPEIKELESKVSNLNVSVLGENEKLDFLKEVSSLEYVKDYSIYKADEDVTFLKLNKSVIGNTTIKFNYDEEEDVYLPLKILTVSDSEFDALRGNEEVDAIYINKYSYKERFVLESVKLTENLTDLEIYGTNEDNEKDLIYKVNNIKTVLTYPFGIEELNGGLTLILSNSKFEEYSKTFDKNIIYKNVVIKTGTEAKLVERIENLVNEKYPDLIVTALKEGATSEVKVNLIYASNIQIYTLIGLVVFIFIFTIYMYDITYTKTREKELGLLKSMGATSKDVREAISRELSSDFLISVLCAVLLSIGLNYGVFKNFYKIDIFGNANIQYIFPIKEIIFVTIASLILFRILVNISTKEIRKKYPIDLIKDNLKEF